MESFLLGIMKAEMKLVRRKAKRRWYIGSQKVLGTENVIDANRVRTEQVDSMRNTNANACRRCDGIVTSYRVEDGVKLFDQFTSGAEFFPGPNRFWNKISKRELF